MEESAEFKRLCKYIERYIRETERGALLFAVCNDELLRKKVEQNISLLLGRHKQNLLVFSFLKDYKPELPVGGQINSVIKQSKAKVDALVLADIEYGLREEVNPKLLTHLNFSREALMAFSIPILIWVSQEVLAQISFYAMDLYDQRVNTLFFDQLVGKSAEILMDGYAMQQTAVANPVAAKYADRIQLLTEQLDAAEQQNADKKHIANDVVIELLNIYPKIPNSERAVQRLLDEYYDFIDLSNPSNLFTLGYAFRGLNEFAKAENSYSEALEKFRKLAGANPQAYLPNVANTLNNLGLLQRATNQLQKAENSYSEALQIRRKLAEANPQAFLPDVALTFNNLGNLQSATNQLQKAENSYCEALQIRRKLAKTNPQAYLPDVAMTLNNLGNLQSDTNQLQKAENSYSKALEIERKLAEANPQAYLPGVARTLNNLGLLQSNTNQLQKAENSYSEALEIERKLAEANPKAYLSGVARTLNNLGLLQSNTNQLQKAENSYSEALQISRKLSESNPQAYLLYVTTTLINKALLFEKTDMERAKPYIGEAKEILEPFKDLPFATNNLKRIKDFAGRNSG